MRRLATILGAVAVAVAAAVVLVVLLQSDGASGPEPPVLVGDVLSDPARYDDATILVSDQVQTVREPFFTLGGDAPSEQLLVYQPPGSNEIITRHDAVDVTGTVERFDPATFADRYDRPFDRFERWRGRLVLVPERIDPSVPDDQTEPS